MKALTLAPPRAYLFFIGTLALLIVGFAIYMKGDVKAGFKMLGIELSIEAKDRSVQPVTKELPQAGK